MGELRCDHCHEVKPDVHQYIEGGRMRTREAEYRLREWLEIDGHHIAAFPKLCGACARIAREAGVLD